MPKGICQNKDCNRLIYDTEKLDELPDKLECQHCGIMNIIRQPVASIEPIIKKVTPIKGKRR